MRCAGFSSKKLVEKRTSDLNATKIIKQSTKIELRCVHLKLFSVIELPYCVISQKLLS